MEAKEAIEISNIGFGDNSPIEDIILMVKAQALRKHKALVLITTNGLKKETIDSLLVFGYKVTEEPISLPMIKSTETIITW